MRGISEEVVTGRSRVRQRAGSGKRAMREAIAGDGRAWPGVSWSADDCQKVRGRCRRHRSAMTGGCSIGTGPVSRSVPVDVPAVSDSDDLDDEAAVEDLVDDPVVPDPHPIGVGLTSHRHAPRWAWLLGQEIDRRSNPLLVLA